MIGIHYEGCKCGMCVWARGVQRSVSQSGSVTLPTFASEWDAAPRSMTRTTERECAEYWFERGKLAGRVAEMVKIAQRSEQ